MTDIWTLAQTASIVVATVIAILGYLFDFRTASGRLSWPGRMAIMLAAVAMLIGFYGIWHSAQVAADEAAEVAAARQDEQANYARLLDLSNRTITELRLGLEPIEHWKITLGLGEPLDPSHPGDQAVLAEFSRQLDELRSNRMLSHLPDEAFSFNRRPATVMPTFRPTVLPVTQYEVTDILYHKGFLYKPEGPEEVRAGMHPLAFLCTVSISIAFSERELASAPEMLGARATEPPNQNLHLATSREVCEDGDPIQLDIPRQRFMLGPVTFNVTDLLDTEGPPVRSVFDLIGRDLRIHAYQSDSGRMVDVELVELNYGSDLLKQRFTGPALGAEPDLTPIIRFPNAAHLCAAVPTDCVADDAFLGWIRSSRHLER